MRTICASICIVFGGSGISCATEWGFGAAPWLTYATLWLTNVAPWLTNVAPWLTYATPWLTYATLWLTYATLWLTNVAPWLTNVAPWLTNVAPWLMDIAQWLTCAMCRRQCAAEWLTCATRYWAEPTTKPEHDTLVAAMTFATVYPLSLAKVEKKGRTKEELHQMIHWVIHWLTGFDDNQLQKHIDDQATFEAFFGRATLNPNVHLITGVICGYRVHDIENQLTRQVRYVDKLVDELAGGRKMEKILRAG